MMLPPCTLIFRRALVFELRLCSWPAQGWYLTGCLNTEGLGLGLNTVASRVWPYPPPVCACVHLHMQSLHSPGVPAATTGAFLGCTVPKEQMQRALSGLPPSPAKVPCAVQLFTRPHGSITVFEKPWTPTGFV